MTRLFLIIICVALFSCSSTSEFQIKESEVPPNVMAAFKEKYPSAQEMEWQAEKDDGKFYFEVDFKDGGKEKEVQITPDGLTISEAD